MSDHDDPEKTIDKSSLTDMLVDELSEALRGGAGPDSSQVQDIIARMRDMGVPITYVRDELRERLGETTARQLDLGPAEPEEAPEEKAPEGGGLLGAIKKFFG